jgi:hypothetical protein
MGCHLGWHFPVGCSLSGGRGEYKTIGTSVPPKTIKEKKVYPWKSGTDIPEHTLQYVHILLKAHFFQD